MTAEEFNALPLEARRYIEKQKTCLSCGRANDLDAHYKNYLIMKQNQLFTLRTGAVPFKSKKTGQSGVLYPIHPNDSEEQIKNKLRLALELNEVAPNKFSVISILEIEKYLSESQEGQEDPNFGTEGIVYKKSPEEADAEIKEANKSLNLDGDGKEIKEAPAKQLHGAAKAAADKKAAEAEEAKKAAEAKELE